MLNLLVTGGAGFIGSNFVHYLLRTETDVNIINLDALTYAGSLENLADLPDPERHIFVNGDICDSELVDRILRQFQITIVVHFAAETHVDRSIVDPGPFIQTNVVGTFSLLDAVRQYWLVEKAFPLSEVRFHHVSTDEVYGSLDSFAPAFSENNSYAPNSPYAASKAASDHLVRAYMKTYGLPVTITHCSNNYGPYQYPEKLIPLMISNALAGRSLPIYGDGGQIRDWLFVEDHCEAIWTVIKKGTPGETYCIGGNNQPSNLTVIKTLCEILDECKPDSPYIPHESLIQFVVDRPGHDRRYAMDITKINQELSWRPNHSLSSGLLRTVEWYLDHPEWAEAIHNHTPYKQWLERNYGQRSIP